jgi:hypothetical protein
MIIENRRPTKVHLTLGTAAFGGVRQSQAFFYA